jgi:hypothetical protein
MLALKGIILKLIWWAVIWPFRSRASLETVILSYANVSMPVIALLCMVAAE